MRRILLLALVCAAATPLFAGGALAQESGTEQYSESDYCKKRIGSKDEPFMSPSYSGEWEYDAINDCIDMRRQAEAADPAPCSEVLEDSHRFGADRVETCREQDRAEPDPPEQYDETLVEDPEGFFVSVGKLVQKICWSATAGRRFSCLIC